MVEKKIYTVPEPSIYSRHTRNASASVFSFYERWQFFLDPLLTLQACIAISMGQRNGIDMNFCMV